MFSFVPRSQGLAGGAKNAKKMPSAKYFLSR